MNSQYIVERACSISLKSCSEPVTEKRGGSKRILLSSSNIKCFHCPLAKLKTGESISVSLLEKICRTLECGYGDIMEYIPDEPKGD